jgi:polysaccharide biosynthesis protein PslH
MRVLFAAAFLPYPPNLGQHMRNWALLRALKTEGHSVTLVSFATPEQINMSLAGLEVLCESVYLVALTKRQGKVGANYLGRLRALCQILPYGVWRFESGEFKATVNRALRDRCHDLIISDDVYQLSNLPTTAAPVVLNKHTIISEEIERYLGYESKQLHRAYGRLERELMLRWERQACAMVSMVLACSERDAERLRGLSPRARVRVAPNVVDTDTYRPAEGDDGRTVLFVGAMDWMPNRDAVEFFVRKSWPLLRNLAPQARLVVAGRNPPPEFVRSFAGQSEIKFTGTVPDLRPFLAQAAVSVVPLRIASGTRIKILEAAAMAKPIVSTAVGAEGLDFENGREIVLADAPLEFARLVAELLNDEQRRHAIGTSARLVAVEKYSIPALARALRTSLGDFNRTTGAVAQL